MIIIKSFIARKEKEQKKFQDENIALSQSNRCEDESRDKVQEQSDIRLCGSTADVQVKNCESVKCSVTDIVTEANCVIASSENDHLDNKSTSISGPATDD